MTASRRPDLIDIAQRARVLRSMFLYRSAWGLFIGVIGSFLTKTDLLSFFFICGIEFLVLEWVHSDRRIIGYDLGVVLDLSVLFVTPVGLFIYFVRSRGWKRGLGSFGLAFVVFLGLVITCVMGVAVGQVISLLLFNRVRGQ